MGLYDGEYYEYQAPCQLDDHEFGMNGRCHKCRHYKDDLINGAIAILRKFRPASLRDDKDL